jgi:hypothetical protein
MPTGVSLFVWLPEERAKWVEMRAKRDPRDVRAMSADLDKAQAEGVELSPPPPPANSSGILIGHVLGTKSVELA